VARHLCFLVSFPATGTRAFLWACCFENVVASCPGEDSLAEVDRVIAARSERLAWALRYLDYIIALGAGPAGPPPRVRLCFGAALVMRPGQCTFY